MAQITYSIAQLHDPKNPVAPWGRSTTYELITLGKLKPRYVNSKPIILHSDLEFLINSLPTEKSK